MRNTTSKKDWKKDIEDRGMSLDFPLPAQGPQLFKHGTSTHILNFLADNPEVNVSISQLARITPVSERATREVVNALEANDMIETNHQGNAWLLFDFPALH